MGNSESDLSNGAGSSEEDSTRRRRENMEKVMGAATAVAAVAAAGFAVAKLLSSSASEDDKTNERGQMLVASGSTSQGYQIPRNNFEDSAYGYYRPDGKTNEGGNLLMGSGSSSGYQITRNKFEDSPYDYYPEKGHVVLEGAGMGGNPTPAKPNTIWRFPGRGKQKMNTDGSVIQDEEGVGGIGQAGFGVVIRDEGGDLIMGFYVRLEDCSIFEAELRGIHRGLKTLQLYSLSKVEIESDSQAAVDHINSENTNAKLPPVIKSIIGECKGMLVRTECTLKQIPREGNRVANRLAKLGRDQEADLVSVSARPDQEVKRLIDEDIEGAKRC